MDDDFDSVTIGVRTDVARFTRDVAEMRAQLEGPLAGAGDRAGRAIEVGLLRAARTGKLGFEDMGKVALSILSQIAAAAMRDGLHSIGVGGKSGGGGIAGGLLNLGTSLLGGLLGLPGRATGGPVAPGAAYLVGERGPEMFVPTSSGQVVPGGQTAPRDVRVSITVNGSGAEAPRALARSARQVARAVRGALGE
ncbi:MAG: tail tape measure protein [Sphingobium sp.]|nr:tail tape measure protein [Sphingobium sp.]